MIPFKFVTPWLFKLRKNQNVVASSFFIFFFFKSEQYKNDQEIVRHEMIHFIQQKELFFIPHWILYLIFHLKYGYRNNPFELEAHSNDKNLNYLNQRKKYAWLNYLKK